MTTKTDIEQDREAFEAALSKKPEAMFWNTSDAMFWAYQAGRAALQSQPINEGWKEAAIAWEVCASIHRQYCKGKDPFFKTRQADFVRHAADSRDRAVADETLQSQDREDAERLYWLLRQLPGDAIRYCVGVIADTADIDEFRAAIDHARRTEGEGE